MYKRIHCYDVDGVLLDSLHRHKFFEDGSLDTIHYFANTIPEVLKKDTVLPLAKQYISDCKNPEIYVILCSVRSMNNFHIYSIAEKIGLPDKLLLVGEYYPPLKSSDVLKLPELRRLFNLRQFKGLPRFLWEDSQKNINTLKHLFTKCFLVPSNFYRTK